VPTTYESQRARTTLAPWQVELKRPVSANQLPTMSLQHAEKAKKRKSEPLLTSAAQHRPRFPPQSQRI